MSSSSNKGLLFWAGKAKFVDFFFLRSINLSVEKINSVKSDLLQTETSLQDIPPCYWHRFRLESYTAITYYFDKKTTVAIILPV